jgi:hypothetical protein
LCGIPPSGEDFVKKWVVDKENKNRQGFGIVKNIQKLYGNTYCDEWDFHTDGRTQMLVLWF